VKQVPPYKPVANEMTGEDKEESGRKRKGGSGGSSGKAGGRGGRGNTTPSPNLSKAGGVSPSTASESGEGAHVAAPAGKATSGAVRRQNQLIFVLNDYLCSGTAGPNGTVANKDLLPPPTPTSAVSAASVIKDPVLGGNQNSAAPQNHGTKFTTSNFVETVSISGVFSPQTRNRNRSLSKKIIIAPTVHIFTPKPNYLNH